jgi:hypothetical protein
MNSFTVNGGEFTFTLICHLGKTHSHRSRGDTTWEAQSAARTHTETQRRRQAQTPDRSIRRGRECQGGERGRPEGAKLTFTDLARANVLTLGRCACARGPHHNFVAEAPLGGGQLRPFPLAACRPDHAPSLGHPAAHRPPKSTRRPLRQQIGCGVVRRSGRVAGPLPPVRSAAFSPAVGVVPCLACERPGLHAVPKLGEIRLGHTRRIDRGSTSYMHMPMCLPLKACDICHHTSDLDAQERR